MKFLKAPLMAAVLGTSALGLSVAAPSETQATPSVPIDVWALRDVVNAVQVSPDGQHLLDSLSSSLTQRLQECANKDEDEMNLSHTLSFEKGATQN